LFAFATSLRLHGRLVIGSPTPFSQHRKLLEKYLIVLRLSSLHFFEPFPGFARSLTKHRFTYPKGVIV
ncbi:MAG: hypothetical protein ACI9QL_002111, partial [Candidatus Omnitrophota bacterium]